MSPDNLPDPPDGLLPAKQETLQFASRRYIAGSELPAVAAVGVFLMSSFKKSARAVIPTGLYRLAARATHGASEGLAGLLALVSAVLPRDVVVALRERTALRGRLDYPRADIYLRVSSRIESRVRLRSCEKEPETIAWLESTLADGDVLYDIGANVGAYSLVAARIPGRSVRVCAFEPGAATFQSLSENIALNGLGDRIIALPIALSRETALIQFAYTSVEAGSARHPGIVADNGAGVRREHVMGFRLDDLGAQFRLPDPTHVKVDVDGSEHLVFEGAQRVLAQRALRSVMVETSPRTPVGETVHRILTGHGFALTAETARGADEANRRYDR